MSCTESERTRCKSIQNSWFPPILRTHKYNTSGSNFSRDVYICRCPELCGRLLQVAEIGVVGVGTLSKGAMKEDMCTQGYQLRTSFVLVWVNAYGMYAGYLEFWRAGEHVINLYVKYVFEQPLHLRLYRSLEGP